VFILAQAEDRMITKNQMVEDSFTPKNIPAAIIGKKGHGNCYLIWNLETAI